MPAVPLPTYETVTIEGLPEYLSLEDAAAALGRTTTRLRQMVDNNNFQRVYAVGRRPAYFFDRAEIEAMAKAQERATSAASA